MIAGIIFTTYAIIMAISLISLIIVQTINHGNHLNLINPGSDEIFIAGQKIVILSANL
jgi:preprotein translocase subunit SecG